jgi:hypothetical protein
MDGVSDEKRYDVSCSRPVGGMQMNIAEAFTQGKVTCEVDGCTRTSTVAVKDFGHLFGQGPVATDLIQIGPIHFLCDFHKRDSYSFKQVDGRWVRF